MTDVLDVSYGEDGEITQFLVLDEAGMPTTKVPSPENLLLYDPEDKLPFEGGMSQFLSGEYALQIHDDPEVLVLQAGDEYSYIVSVGGDVVETTAAQSGRVLRGVYDSIVDGNAEPLIQLYQSIIKNQARRQIINPLRKTFDSPSRITVESNGWVIDGFYLVDWDAKLYTVDDDPEDGDYIREGGVAVKKDKSYEAIQLKGDISTGDTVTLNGTEYELTKRECEFLAKVTWLLNRRHYHPDMPFWFYTDRWSNVNWKTGRPNNEPDLDKFTL